MAAAWMLCVVTDETSAFGPVRRPVKALKTMSTKQILAEFSQAGIVCRHSAVD